MWIKRNSSVSPIALGAFILFLSVVLGAFGAHLLTTRVSEKYLQIYKTGVEYQVIHGFGLILYGLFLEKHPKASKITVLLFILGITLFSGSLYLLVLTEKSWLGAITPLGGLSFMTGWLFFAFQAKKYS